MEKNNNNVFKQIENILVEKYVVLCYKMSKDNVTDLSPLKL